MESIFNLVETLLQGAFIFVSIVIVIVLTVGLCLKLFGTEEK